MTEDSQESIFIESNIIEPFSEFEESEKEREKFVKELLLLDSILQFEDYLDRVNILNLQKLTIDIKNAVINLDFAQRYCKEYSRLKNENEINNVENLRAKKKLRIYCRDIASDLDVFPKRTGNLEKELPYLA